MATDEAKISYALEATNSTLARDLARTRRLLDSEANKMGRSLSDAMDRVGRTPAPQFRIAAALRRESQEASSIVSRMTADLNSKVTSGLSGIGPRLAGGIAAGFSAREIGRMADEWTSAVNKITAATGNATTAPGQADMVGQIAERSRASFTETADLYARMSRASKELGATQGEVAVVTETVSKAMKLAGATTQESAAAALQLGQALGSGRLQGDELRSLLENAPVLAQAIAKEFNTTIGGLRDLGTAGVLTSDRVFAALKKAAPEVEAAFAKTTSTVSDAFKSLEAAAIRYVGQSALVKAGTSAVVAGVQGLANNFDVVATGAAALGTVLAVRLVASGLVPSAVGLVGLATAATGAGAALAGAAAVAAGPAALLTRIVGLFGGPVGLAILGATAAVAYFATEAVKGTDASKAYADAARQIADAANAATPAIKANGDAAEEAAKKTAAAAQSKQESLLKTLENDARNLQTQLHGTMQTLQQFGAVKVSESEKKAAVDLITSALNGNAAAALDAHKALKAMGEANPSFAAALASASLMIERLAVLRTAADQTRTSIAGVAKAQVDEEAAKIAKAVPNPTAGTRFEDDATGVTRDPVVKDLIGQGMARRAVVDAEMDETERKVRDKTKELRDKIFAAGGTATAGLERDAAAIVAAEGKSKGGGGGGSAEKRNEFDREETATSRRIRNLGAESAAIGLNSFEAAKAESAFRLLEAAKAANLPVDDALRARIDTLSERYAAATVAIEAARRGQAQFLELQGFAGSGLMDLTKSLITAGNAGESVMQRLANATQRFADKLVDAALQAALLGQGPLAGMMGTGSGDRGFVGGIVGSLFRGFGGGGSDLAPAGADLTSTVFHHGGGVVGTGSPRPMPSSLFLNAPRLHGGTLRADEQAAILQKGEEVITRDQRRGITGTMAALADMKGGGGSTQVNIQPAPGTEAKVAKRQSATGTAVDVLIRKVIADDLANGGELSQQFEGMYGMNRMRGRS